MGGPGDPYFLSTLDKGLRVLALFDQDRRSLSQAEIAREVGLNKTSAYRFANTLVGLGFLKKDPRTKLLSLGVRAFRLALGFYQGYDPLQVVKPVVDQAFSRLKITIDVAALDGQTLFILYRREAGDTLNFHLPTVVPELHCNALGKAVLAHLDAKAVSALLGAGRLKRRTANTLTDRSDLEADLALVRERGYAVNDEEFVLGLISIAAPLIDATAGRIRGAVSFDFSTAEFDLARIEGRYVKPLKKLAEEISGLLPPG